MKRGTIICLLACCTLSAAGDWPNPLGPAYTGVQKGSGFPVYWSRNDGVIWQVRLPYGTATSAPLVVGTQVLLTTSSAAGDETALTSFEAKSGRIQWSKSWRGTSKISMAAEPQWVAIAEEAGTIHCFSLEGELLWEKKQTAQLTQLLAENGNVFLLAQQGNVMKLIALTGKQGKELWSRDLGAVGQNGDERIVPVASLGLLLSVTSGDVVALDAKNGKEIWRASTSQLYGKEGQVALTGDGCVLIRQAPGNQVALHEATAKGLELRWKARTDAVIEVPHFLSHPAGVVLLNTERNELEVFDRKTGSRRYNLRLPVGKWSALLATSNLAYCYSEDREVAVIDLAAGKVLSRTLMADGRDRAGLQGLAFLLDRLIVSDGLNLYCVTGTKVGSRAEETSPAGNPPAERVGAPANSGRRLPL